MKNVTITLDEDTAQWVRVQAALRETSVSRLVGDILKQERLRDVDYQSAMTRYLSRDPQALKAADTEYPDRESLHDRPLLR